MNQDTSTAPDPGLRRRRLLVGLLVLSFTAVAIVAVSGGALATWISDNAARRAQAAVADSLKTPDDLLAWIQSHPENAALVVMDSGKVSLGVSEHAFRPVAGLPTLLLAAELARRADAGLDLTQIVTASTIREQRLPYVEPEAVDTMALGLAALTREALQGDRAAADALLLTLGRDAVDRIPSRLGLDSLDAPLPTGGLRVAWTSGRMGVPPLEELDAFLRTPRPARRDSAYARSLALANSPSFRAEFTAWLRDTDPRLTPDQQRRAALRTYPRGTATAYARLLSETPGTFLRLVTSRAPNELLARRSARIGVHTGSAPGLRSVSGVHIDVNGRVRVAVLSLAGARQAVLDHLASGDLDAALIRQLLTR